ncbi:hypothetical protein [Tetragenococcus solitarius]|uniref:TPM domain-containing protein n=1 Tax=Tetragenococcus solitarius TaxID=71453 RepID=A0ABN3Y6V3_9ENTE|nr:hypothetical protein [Tetragenococcus solitarius]
MKTYVTENAIRRTMENVINREIGCFTDEVNKAHNIYFLTDTDTERMNRFFKSINAKPINVEPFNISEKDLLIVFDSEIELNDEFYYIVKNFKYSGGHVAAIVANRKLSYIKFVDELLGININQTDIKKYGTGKIFDEVVDKVLDEVDKRVLYFKKIVK